MKDQSRNKAKDVLSDYWKSNRETEKANAEALKKQQAGQTEQEKKRWKFSEKANVGCYRSRSYRDSYTIRSLLIEV